VDGCDVESSPGLHEGEPWLQILLCGTGEVMEGVLAAFAQFDNDVRSDRTRADMKAAPELG
jgi:hypothetical protein